MISIIIRQSEIKRHEYVLPAMRDAVMQVKKTLGLAMLSTDAVQMKAPVRNQLALLPTSVSMVNRQAMPL